MSRLLHMRNKTNMARDGLNVGCKMCFFYLVATSAVIKENHHNDEVCMKDSHNKICTTTTNKA